MIDTNKLKKLARMKDENPELFEQLLRDNYDNNPQWRNLMDAMPVSGAVRDLATRTWLDSKLLSVEGVDERKLKDMSPAEKVEIYLVSEDIYGYTEEIIRAVGDAYGVNLPI